MVVGILKISLDRQFYLLFFTKEEFIRVLLCHVAVSSE